MRWRGVTAILEAILAPREVSNTERPVEDFIALICLGMLSSTEVTNASKEELVWHRGWYNTNLFSPVVGCGQKYYAG